MQENQPMEPLPMTIRPVGRVETDLEKPVRRSHDTIDPAVKRQQAKENYAKIKAAVSRIIIDPEFEELLDGVEDFSHILVLYWPHRLPESERNVRKVHPMGRQDIPLKGVFATRSPARPNPVLVSTVRLLEREGNILRVQGLEALDGSPVIDIKPYTAFDPSDGAPVFPEWIERLHNDLKS